MAMKANSFLILKVVKALADISIYTEDSGLEVNYKTNVKITWG